MCSCLLKPVITTLQQALNCLIAPLNTIKLLLKLAHKVQLAQSISGNLMRSEHAILVLYLQAIAYYMPFMGFLRALQQPFRYKLKVYFALKAKTKLHSCPLQQIFCVLLKDSFFYCQNKTLLPSHCLRHQFFCLIKPLLVCPRSAVIYHLSFISQAEPS